MVKAALTFNVYEFPGKNTPIGPVINVYGWVTVMITVSPGPPAPLGHPPPLSKQVKLISPAVARPSEKVSTVWMIELYLDREHVPPLPVMHCPVMAYRPACRTAFWRVNFVENRYPNSIVPSTSSKKIDNEIAVSTSV